MDDQTRVNGYQHRPPAGSNAHGHGQATAGGHRYANLVPAVVGTALLVGLICGGTGLAHPVAGFAACYLALAVLTAVLLCPDED